MTGTGCIVPNSHLACSPPPASALPANTRIFAVPLSAVTVYDTTVLGFMVGRVHGRQAAWACGYQPSAEIRLKIVSFHDTTVSHIV